MTKRFPHGFENANGLSLVEALMAMFILSIGLLAIGTLLFSVMGYNQYSDTITTATTLAQDKLEILKKTAYSSIAAGTATESNIDDEGNSGGIYTRITGVDTSLIGLKIVDVEVRWNWNGQLRSVSLKTMLKE